MRGRGGRTVTNRPSGKPGDIPEKLDLTLCRRHQLVLVKANPVGTTPTEVSIKEVVEYPVDKTTLELKGGESSNT